ncbi:MAG: hypothetical protein OHK0032_11930 [Thermodesulfovibrionales bacterium]
MSLLSDLLSRIKHPEPSKEVPPGLRSTVSALKKKESNKRRVVIVVILAILTVGAGFATVYLIEVYLKGGVKQTASQKGIADGLVARQAIPSPSVSNESLTEDRRQRTEDRRQKTDNKQITDSRGQSGERETNDKLREKRLSHERGATLPNSRPEPSARTLRSAARSSPQPAEGTDKKEVTLKISKGDQPVQQQEGQKGTTKAEKLPDTSEKDLHLYMARAYESKMDYSNALLSYKKVLSIEPRNYRVMNNIASILIKLNLYDEAKTYLEMALGVRNDYVPGLINTGIVLARLGETQNAENSLLKALTLEPDNRNALLNIAILYEKKGSYEKAREYYLRLKQLGDAQGSLGLERIGSSKEK